ncbi:signal peptidase I [Euzebya sp.]|uniref:signal peptidase I n=1 Tax=Euzebya sp. TaxID=1971409 RepID=UPI0035194904
MAELQTDPDPGAGDTEDRVAEDPIAAPRRRRSVWGELPALIVVALVLAVLLKTFVVQAFYIPSSSMEPTLQVGDRVLVTKTAYWFREPRRGEVVVFAESEEGGGDGNFVSEAFASLANGIGVTAGDERDFIKRIIGLPGDTVELRDGIVLINGEPLPESSAEDGGYLSRPDLNDFGPVTVEEDHYFMLGDNRPNSADSRFGLGQIHRDQIVGRAFVTIWPLDQVGSLPIASY